ncbi:hypothetical protein LZ337_23365 [Serratia marcescens]|uniref:hypothetical protein n=1 Tax=Serratia marcescens TaxID=615 RepID=UPI001F0567E1|nr:hypothetical protein [Serratia marcescens]MDM1791350.1 hypothetical protein [Serratia marcescens]MDM1796994.1 hypothetical protein [Serratia marcescens]MDM1802527.1 hypothetical protein [Serratia marcescens]MDM1807783.1 hypothetical protein [Serratia marcescens]MDM1813453.1 hypothetical protein [Serratia marcescens]
MGSIILAGRQIFILNENDRYPEPTINSPPMFAIREDEGAGRSYQKLLLKPRVKPLTRL